MSPSSISSACGVRFGPMRMDALTAAVAAHQPCQWPVPLHLAVQFGTVLLRHEYQVELVMALDPPSKAEATEAFMCAEKSPYVC